MLKKILPPKKCEECRGCCYFDSSDLYEIPYILPKLAEYIKENYRHVELTRTGTGYKFTHPDELSENEYFICPMLSKSGCVLGDNKPFDCLIYPLAVMKDRNGTNKIATANYCKAVSEILIEKLKDFLLTSGLYKKIMTYADENPFIVLDYSENYTIIANL